MKPLVHAPGAVPRIPLQHGGGRGIGLAYARTPFARDVYRPEEPLPFGLTVSEVLSTVPELPDRFWTHGVVCLNYVWRGKAVVEEVPRVWWDSVRLTERPVAVTVTLHLGLAGGGGGQKNTFALVASIALIAATAAISGGALGPGGLAVAGGLFGAGSTSAALLAAGVGIVGGLAFAALSPPPTLDVGKKQDVPTFGSASASANQLEPGGVIPRVVGRVRVFPSFAANPLVELVGTDEVVEALFALAGPHEWSLIRIDGVPIESFDDVEFETVEGFPANPPISLIERQSHTDGQPVELDQHDYNLTTNSDGRLRTQGDPTLSLPQWTTKITRRSPDEVWLTLFAPSGFINNDQPDEVQMMPLRIRVRPRGTATWFNCPEIMLGSIGPRPLKISLRFIWRDAPVGGLPTPPIHFGPLFAYKVVPTQTATPVGVGGWTANSHFSAGAGSDLYSSATVGTTKVRNVHLYEDRVVFYLGPPADPFSPLSHAAASSATGAAWEIQVQRGYIHPLALFTAATYRTTGIDDSNNVFDFFGYRTVASVHLAGPDPDLTADTISIVRNSSVWNEHPVVGTGHALLAVKAKNRAIANVSAYVGGHVPIWDGAAWLGASPTQNPASHYRYALVGGVNADRLPVALLDNASLVEWRARSIADGHTANFVADGRNLDEVLRVIAGCGYARPRQSELWGVIQDRDRSGEAPVQIFTPRNSRNFRFSKAFPILPHGFHVRWRDSTRDFEEGEPIVVYDEGYSATNAERLEEIAYEGITTEDAVRARAEFDLKQARLRSAFYEFECDVEALVTTRGDLIGVQHDILATQAGFARVREVSVDAGMVTGLVLDSKIATSLGSDFFSIPDVFAVDDIFAAEGTTGIAIRLKDGSGLIISHQLSDPLGYVDEIEFGTPFADPGADLLGEGCLIASGVLGSEYRRLIITGVQPGNDLTAVVTCVDEAEALWPRILALTGTISALGTLAGDMGLQGGVDAAATIEGSLRMTAMVLNGTIAGSSTVSGQFPRGHSSGFSSGFG